MDRRGSDEAQRERMSDDHCSICVVALEQQVRASAASCSCVSFRGAACEFGVSRDSLATDSGFAAGQGQAGLNWSLRVWNASRIAKTRSATVNAPRGDVASQWTRVPADSNGSPHLPIFGVGREAQLDFSTSMDFGTLTIYPGGSRVPGMTRGVSRDAESGHGNGERAGGRRGAVGTAGDRMGRRAEIADAGAAGMEIPRVFSTEGSSPFDQVDWELRTAEIKDERGRIIFQQTDCEIPRAWSQLATNVVASKYFYGDVASGNGSPAEGNREYSVRQLIDRVTRTIADWGKEDGYFATAADAERFYDELTALCLNQYGSFNSPVWFNVGLFHRYGISGPANNWRWDEETRAVTKATSAYQYPQASACFIQSVSDDMEGIMRLAKSEAMLFKFGSGTGTDLSTLALEP